MIKTPVGPDVISHYLLVIDADGHEACRIRRDIPGAEERCRDICFSLNTFAEALALVEHRTEGVELARMMVAATRVERE